MNIITTLNPKFSLSIAAISLAVLANEIIVGNGIVSFFAGAAATLPLIMKIWKTMKNNWPVYRKFYSTSFYTRDMNVVKKSWKLTWWIVPYTVVVYSIADIYILLNPYLGTPYGLLSGSIFTTAAYTFFQSPKYYDDLKNAVKK